MEQQQFYQDQFYAKGDGIALVKAGKRYRLDIHHKIYVLNKMPWENFDQDLETMCNWCHWELHEKEKIEAYYLKDGKLVSAKMTPCYRCHSAGRFPEYAHIEAGICFRCEGKRFEELISKA